MFGTSGTQATTGTTSLFGGGSQLNQSFGTSGVAAGTQQSLFGASGTAATGGASSTGGLFGNTNNSGAPGGLTGAGWNNSNASNASNSNLFGQTASLGSTSGGLFGSGNSSSTGGGLFGGTNTLGGISNSNSTQNNAGSLFGSASGTGAALQPAGSGTTTIQQPSTAFSFIGALSAIPHADVSELRYGVIPDGASEESCIRARIIPQPLHTQLLEQQVDMNRQGLLLDNILNYSSKELVRLLECTSHMNQGVLRLRNAVAKQEETIKGLKDEAKSLKAIDKGLHEARRMTTPSRFSVEKPLPSDFFWELLQDLEAHVSEYDLKTKELASMLAESKKGLNLSRRETIVSILSQQHTTFMAIASLVADMHGRMDEVREQYHDWHLRVHGDSPRDFEQEDSKERENRRKLLRRVEEQASALSAMNNQAIGSNQNSASQQSVQQAYFTPQTVNTTSSGSLFGTSNAAQIGSTQATTSLFSSPSKNNAASTGENTTLFPSTPGSKSLWDTNNSLSGAPRKDQNSGSRRNKSKR